jgi:hypothetical protein
VFVLVEVADTTVRAVSRTGDQLGEEFTPNVSFSVDEILG